MWLQLSALCMTLALRQDRPPPGRRRPSLRPRLESLEDRFVPSATDNSFSGLSNSVIRFDPTFDDDFHNNNYGVVVNDEAGDEPSHGTVVVETDADGFYKGIAYTPDTNFRGQDSFFYTLKANDGSNAIDFATVTVTVNNRAPTAVADPGSVLSNTTGNVINVLGNDTDSEKDALTITGATPAKGTAQVSGANLLYTPPANFRGTDTVTYTIADGHNGTATGKLTVTVTNRAPVAQADVFTLPTASTNVLSPLSNDTDPEGDALTITSVARPAHGTATAAGTQIRYTPAAGFSGQDTLTYTVSDGHGGSATGSVTVNVPAEVRVTTPFRARGRGGVVTFGRQIVVDTGDPLSPVRVVVTASRGHLKAKGRGVLVRGNNTRSITISGNAAAVNRALAALSLDLGRPKLTARVTVTAFAGRLSDSDVINVSA